MAKTLDRDQIVASSLPEFIQLRSSNFVIRNESGSDELRNDAKRNILFHALHLFDGDEARIDQASQTELEQEIAKCLSLNWDLQSVKDLASAIVTNYTQGLLFPALAIGTFAPMASNGKVIISDKPSNVRSDTTYIADLSYNENDKTIHFELVIPNYYVTYMDGAKITDQFSVDGSRWIYKLVNNGFEFVSAKIDNDKIYDIFLGNNPPESAEAFKASAQKPSQTIPEQLAKAFHDVYNVNNASRTNLRAFLGITDYSWDSYNERYDTIEKYSLGVLLSIPKNIVKLITEFLPKAIENTSLVIMQRISDRYDNLAARILLQAVPATVLAIAWTYRQFARRLTSPAQSCKEAYNATSNKFLGTVLAATSAIVSIAAFVAVGYGAAIGLAAAGVPFLAKAAIWESAETASVGSFLTALGTKAAGLVGVSLSPFAASVLSGAAITAVITAAVVFIRDRFQAALHWKENNDLRSTHDAREIARPEQDKREAARLAAYPQREEPAHKVTLTPPSSPRRDRSVSEQKLSNSRTVRFWDEDSDNDDQFKSKYDDEVKEEKTPQSPRKPNTPL